MLLSDIKYCQDKFSLPGSVSNRFNNSFNYSSIEGIADNFSGLKDWEFSVIYGQEFSQNSAGNIYLLSVSKRIDNHFFSARYTPGYQKDFTFSSGTHFINTDSIPSALKSRFHYEEKFGLGYSFHFMPDFSAGITLRYFAQEISQDQLRTYFTDSTTLISVDTESKKYNFWRGDLSLSYSPAFDITLGLSTINLFTPEESDETNNTFQLKRAKGIGFTAFYNPVNLFAASFTYETSGSMLAGTNLNMKAFDGTLSFSLQTIHDKYQQPFIAGIIPALNFSNRHFSLTLSYIKYTDDRKKSGSYQDFAANGIHNIINNKYSYDKASLALNFALSTTAEKQVKFIDVKVTQDIFPTLSDVYLDSPFAVARVVNLTSKQIVVKPSSYVPAINKEYIQSPQVTINPNDTADVPFFTLIDEVAALSGKAEISQATFLLNTESYDAGDEFRKPVLINDYNSWDGKVINLRYFADNNINLIQEFAKEVLQKNKSLLDTIPAILNSFYSAKILFESVIKNLVYVADPRASVDRVQFPRETLRLKGGDCEDLSVLFSSLFESIGIQAAYVDYKSDSGISHVSLLFNSGLSAEQARLITSNDRKYFLRQNNENKDEVWLPIEPTSLTTFNTSWEIAAEKFQSDAIDKFGLAKGLVQIVDTP
ncbi:MAG: transglutaminase domain-containing protein [Ignavibacteriales bacterium]|nr:MAG: transglutaminase domain-containing protein [Ignavibacteriales bacterium]